MSRTRVFRPTLFGIVAIICLAACGGVSQIHSSQSGKDLAPVDTGGAPLNTALAAPTQPVVFGPNAQRTETPASLVAVSRASTSQFKSDPVAALNGVLARSGLLDIRSAHIGAMPLGQQWGGSWLFVDVSVPSMNARIHADWEADLLLADVAEEAAAGLNLGDSIEGIVETYVLPDGSRTEAAPRLLGNIAAGQNFGSSGDSGVIKLTAVNTLAAFGLTAISVEILRPLDFTLDIVASVPSAQMLKGNLQLIEARLRGTPPTVEGFFLHIVLPDGQPIATVAAAFRSGAGIESIQPNLGVDIGGTHG